MGEELFSFSPGDKVPGFYGQDLFGTSGQSAAGLPISVLLIGLALSGGGITPDQQFQQIFQETDADTLGGVGGELACMAYDTLQNPDAQDVPVYIASPTPANGAVAAYGQITIAGTWTAAGPIGLRIGGVFISINVQAIDTATTAATALAAAINGTLQGRLPISASSSAGVITLTCRTAGVRGNQHIVFLSQQAGAPPSGLTITITGQTWATGTTATLTTFTVPTVANGYYYKITTVGGTPTFGSVQPTWPTTVGTATSADSNGNVWTCWGQVVNGGGVTLGGGSGLESYTNLLATLASIPGGYGRIALACNDATSLAAFKAAIDADAGPLVGELQHAIAAINTTQAAATSLAQTTLNDPSFQFLFQQSAETHPSRLAANMACERAFHEVADPNFNYDGFVLTSCAPQTQPLDCPLHSQQVAMLNVGVTPLTTVAQQTQVVRSITTKSLTSGQPDYSVLDTGYAVVPYFMLQQLRVAWIGYQKANPRLEPNPDLAAGERQAQSGVATPNGWNAVVTRIFMEAEDGELPGTCPPILFNVENFPPQSSLDPTTAGRLLTIAPCYPTANTHQLAISVNEALAIN